MKERNNAYQISEIIGFFQTKKTKITKFNHCIDSDQHKVSQFDGFI